MILCVMAFSTLSAQIRGSEIQVLVQPDHQDWTYKTGEKATFTVSVLRSGTLVDNVSIDLAAGPEMYQDVKKQTVLKDGTTKLTGTMKQPGFYRVDVTAHVDGKDYKGACGAAFSPELLQPSTVMPKDFSEFWQGVISEARKTPLEPTKRLLPERCTKDVNVYEVSFQNLQANYRTYGILCVPVKEGKYPALLRVPGAGVRPYGGDIWTATQGAITLEIGIHGIPVTMEQKVYDDVFNGARDRRLYPCSRLYRGVHTLERKGTGCDGFVSGWIPLTRDGRSRQAHHLLCPCARRLLRPHELTERHRLWLAALFLL